MKICSNSKNTGNAEELVAFFTRLSLKTASTINLEQLLEYVLFEILEFLAADSGSLMIFDPIEHQLKLFRSIIHPDIPKGKIVSINEGVAGTVFRTGKPILVEDSRFSAPELRLRNAKEGGSFISVLLRVSRRKIGVLNLNRPKGRPGFNAKDLKILETLKGQVSGIIEKGRLLDELKKRTNEIESLYNLTKVLHSGLGFEQTLQSFLRHLAKDLSMERSAIIKFVESDKPFKMSDVSDFEILAALNLKNEDLKRISISVLEQLKADLLDHGAPYWDKIDLSAPTTLSYLDDEKPMELFCLPLPGEKSTRNHFLIITIRRDLLIDQDVAKRYYRLLRVISKQLGIVVEREAMMKVIHQDQKLLMDSAYKTSIYLEISKELASTLNPRIILKKAFEQFGKLIQFSTISILLFNDLEGFYQTIIQPTQPVSSSYIRRLKAEIPKIFKEYPAEPPLSESTKIHFEIFDPQLPTGLPLNVYKHTLYLPIILIDQMTGLIHLSRAENRPYTASDLDTITQFTGIFITSLKNAIIHRKTEKLAFTDPLTGLFNHRYFQETLKQEFIRSRRYQKPLSLMILDIDHFKRFNDLFGHLVGDQVLMHSGRLFKKSVREKIDIVARYGGEEFVVVLPETGLIGAKNFAERIRVCIEKEPLMGQRENLSVTISIGVACTIDTLCEKPADLIEAADTALYMAKNGGRNQVCVFRGELKKENMYLLNNSG